MLAAHWPILILYLGSIHLSIYVSFFLSFFQMLASQTKARDLADSAQLNAMTKTVHDSYASMQVIPLQAMRDAAAKALFCIGFSCTLLVRGVCCDVCWFSCCFQCFVRGNRLARLLCHRASLCQVFFWAGACAMVFPFVCFWCRVCAVLRLWVCLRICEWFVCLLVCYCWFVCVFVCLRHWAIRYMWCDAMHFV